MIRPALLVKFTVLLCPRLMGTYGKREPNAKKRKLRQSCISFQLCQCFTSIYARNVINLAFSLVVNYLQDMSSQALNGRGSASALTQG